LVVGATVEFDDEAFLGPEHVDFVAREPDIDGRRGKAGIQAQVEEPALELRARNVREILIGQQRQLQSGDTVSPRTSVDKGLDGSKIEQAQPLGLFDGTLENIPTSQLGEVQQSSGHRSDGYSFHAGAIVRVKTRHQVDGDTGTLSARPAWNGHVDHLPIARLESPKRRCTVMT
jgi:hypothetical protein